MKRITPEVEQLILAQIRAGSSAAIAAEAAGVPRIVFAAWLQMGRRRPGRCRQFWLKVRQARARAYARAVIEARAQDVKFWLRYGPGKTRKQATADHALLDLFHLLGQLAEQLQPLPEARQAILNLLDLPAR